MNDSAIAGREKPFATLRRFTQSKTAKSAQPEQCELCNISLAAVHRHLLVTAERRVVCACNGCALSFQDVVGGRFQLIPRDTRKLSDFLLSDAQWESLALPINMVFFFRSAQTGKITAMYPSPAGATESLLPLETWEMLVSDNPVLSKMQPDVEALLVNRTDTTRQYYLAPMDVCYELVGLIRIHWRGLSGGEVVWREIAVFFERLEADHG
jgi:hypothetical protein